MAGFSLGDDDELISDINITPFVDVVLVLLIIFMVTTNFIVKAAIEVELPKSATGESIAKPQVAVVVACLGEGDNACAETGIFLNEEKVEDAQALREAVTAKVDAALANCSDQDKPEETCGTQALITADAGLRYADVIVAIDAVKLAGVSSFALNSELFTDGSEEEDAP